MTLGEYLVRLLEAYGVQHVFGIPGVHTVELYRGVSGSRLRHVLPRHERGAGFMADGYARVTGRPGVCFVITGPGLTNILTAMGQAHAVSIPMLVISSVNRRTDLGHAHGLLHEVPDQSSTVRSVTAFSHQLQSFQELQGVLARAFAIFQGERPRPVHIEIPIDVMTLPVPDGIPTPAIPAFRPAAPDPIVLREVNDRIAVANRSLMLLGGGCRGVDRSLLRRAIERIGAPVVMTINGRECLAHDHPLAVPASRSMRAIREEMMAADLLIAVGTEVGRTDYDMFGAGMISPPAPLIRVDIDAKQLAGSQFPRINPDDLLIHADAGAFLAALANGESAARADAEVRARALRAAARAELTPDMGAGLDLLEQMRDDLPDAIAVGDSTQPVYAGNLYYGVTTQGMWFNSSVGFGTLGYALPAAIGARLGRPGQPVIALIGDGGLQFTLSELGTIPDNVPVLVMVWNNHGYGEIRSSMNAVGVTPVGVDFAPPRFDHIAAAFGMDYSAPADISALRNILKSFAGTKRSLLMEVSQDMVYATAGIDTAQRAMTDAL